MYQGVFKEAAVEFSKKSTKSTSFPGSTPLSRWRPGTEKTLAPAGKIIHESWSILRSKLVFSTLDQRFRVDPGNEVGTKYSVLT